MSVSEKIKTIDSNIKQKKGQYNLDKQGAKVLDLLSGNVG